jgi:uncharacterized membrane protein
MTYLELFDAYQIALMSGNTRKAKKMIRKIIRLSGYGVKPLTFIKAAKKVAKQAKQFRG